MWIAIGLITAGVILFFIARRIDDNNWKRIVDIITILGVLAALVIFFIESDPKSPNQTEKLTPSSTLTLTPTLYLISTPSPTNTLTQTPTETQTHTPTPSTTATPTSTATHPTMNTVAPKILFEDDFLSNMNNWDLEVVDADDGSFKSFNRIAKGSFTQTFDCYQGAERCVRWNPIPRGMKYEDFILEFDLTYKEISDSCLPKLPHICIRFRKDEDTNSFYRFCINPEGTYISHRILEGNYLTLDYWTKTTYKKHDKKTTNHYVIIVQGTDYWFYAREIVNEKELDNPLSLETVIENSIYNFEDGEIVRPGSIEIGIFSVSGCKVVVETDHISISEFP